MVYNVIYSRNASYFQCFIAFVLAAYGFEFNFKYFIFIFLISKCFDGAD